ncbi:MAG TPA: sugar-binding protein [Phycisphaerae bacterium]|nr:sugar-binding protein [Phycisphaerae bacterium]
MMLKMQWLGAVFLIAAGLGVVGCGKSDEGGAGGGNGTGAATQAVDANRHLRLAFVTNNAANFWTIARAGCEKAKEEIPNIDFEFRIPSQPTAAEQKRVVDDLLARGLDGLAISPVDPTNQTRMLNEVASKAMLITQDSDAPQSNRACYIGTDNKAAGRQAGECLKKALPQGGKIVLFVGSRDAQNARDRQSGIEEAIKGTGIEIIDVRTDETDTVRAKANAQDALVKYPDIAGLVGLWSYNGPAILSAVERSDRVGKVQIVCFDEDEATLEGVKSGAIYATIVQQPFEFGRQSMELMAKTLRGDNSLIPASKQIFIPTLAITRSEVSDFADKLHKILGTAH